MLNEEELNDMSELDRGPRFLEVKCDCTNRKYGDFTGRLRISTLAMLCSLASPNPTVRKWGNDYHMIMNAILTPDNFLKHCGKEGTRNWKRNSRVIVNDEKVALQKWVDRPHSTDSKSSERERKFHRDEFIKCSTCNKERRFRLRNHVCFGCLKCPFWTVIAALVPGKSSKAIISSTSGSNSIREVFN
ncbi:hypothetical protein I3843_11G170400 [Carya illinoinensis]|nr:hypothetical protein I3843_11G170400 [Carya illinoinensis]